MIPKKILYFPYKSYVVLNPRAENKQVFALLTDIKVVLNRHKTLFDIEVYKYFSILIVISVR